jgi:hypothetical protein
MNDLIGYLRRLAQLRKIRKELREDLDLENLDGVPLEELRRIRRALGHDVEKEEQEFLALLKSRGLLKDSPSATEEQ